MPSVTEILSKFKNAAPLVGWAWKNGHAAGYASAKNLPAPRNANEERDQAAQSGQLAHDMIEAFILGKPYVYDGKKPLAIVQQRAEKAFENAKKWLSGSCITVTDTETPLVSERYKFGGTRDAKGVTPDERRRLLDWKSSGRVYPDYMIQLAAYDLLAEECEGAAFDGGYDILRFDKEYADFQHHHYDDLVVQKKAFLLMVELYPLVVQTEDRCG